MQDLSGGPCRRGAYAGGSAPDGKSPLSGAARWAVEHRIPAADSGGEESQTPNPNARESVSFPPELARILQFLEFL